jgi:hypothetical protein
MGRGSRKLVARQERSQPGIGECSCAEHALAKPRLRQDLTGDLLFRLEAENFDEHPIPTIPL